MKTRFHNTVLVVLCLSLAPLCLATPPKNPKPSPVVSACVQQPPFTAEQIQVIGAEPNSQDVQDLLAVYSDLNNALNRHDINDFLKHFNPSFISGDNLSLAQLKKLVTEAWEAYPDICSDSKPLELRINGDWATIEVLDRSIATAPPDKKIMNVPGRLVSDSRSILYLRRMGNTWEITSDLTLWEHAIIRYGIGEEVQIGISAPDQVKAGETYSAIIKANVPDGTLSIVTIDNQPLTYPHQKIDDKFRALSDETKELQRVLKANSTNHNEIVTVTIGLTNVEQKDPERPSLSLNGIATLIKRVNVVPISAEDVIKEMQKQDLVRTSANGKINLLNQKSEDTSSSFELELAPKNDAPEGLPLED